MTMSRFLTPSKIGLLAVIELYVEESVPNEAVLPVLTFLTSHLVDHDSSQTAGPSTSRWTRAEESIRLVSSIKDFELLLSPHAAADGMPGRRLWDRFLEKLWAIDSLHGLQEFFHRRPHRLMRTREELQAMIARGEQAPSGIILSRNSPFGMLVRRSHLEFSRLAFNQATDLWKALIQYRQPTAVYWRKRNPGLGPLGFDSVLGASDCGWGNKVEDIAMMVYGDVLTRDRIGPSAVSTDEIETLLEFQIDQVQSGSPTGMDLVPILTCVGYGSRVPAEIRDKFKGLLDDSDVIASLSHYLQFSDAWRSGDYPTSFDYLHRYFDYTMQNRDRLFYQYALMNLAIIQSDFGCHREAVAIMLEAISTARENRDMTCLNFALNWFFHFSKAHPHLVREVESNSMFGNGRDILSFIRTKAKETNMWILFSSALLSEAKLGLSQGESISSSLEYMVQSSQVIIQHNMRTMMGAQLSMTITLWDRLGISFLSTLTCQVFLRCHARNSVFDDELKITCRLAGLLASRGKYDEALDRLEALDSHSLRAVKASQYWHQYRGLIKLRRDLHRNQLDSAETRLSQLLQARPEDLEPDMIFVVDSLHVEALTRRGHLDAALSKVNRLITDLGKDDRDIALRIRLFLTKTHLFDRAGRPQKGFSIAMRAARLAWKSRLVPLIWQAAGALANILNSLGEFDASARLLIAVLPRCLETDAAFMAGTLFSFLADAHMGQAGERTGRGAAGKRTEFLVKAHQALERAFAFFSAVEDAEKQCEMLAKKATVMKAVGDRVLAGDYAAKYLAFKAEVDARSAQ